jgi:phosphatidylglycerol---prolipoprotein diacylglyceryl transferase
VTFFHPGSLAPLHVPLHPTQLYHSLAGLVCFVVVLALKTKTRGTGQLMGIFLALFGTMRFVIELFRADYRGDFGPVSVTQLIALCAAGLGLFIIQHRRRNVL